MQDAWLRNAVAGGRIDEAHDAVVDRDGIRRTKVGRSEENSGLNKRWTKSNGKGEKASMYKIVECRVSRCESRIMNEGMSQKSQGWSCEASKN